jgi:hypothetical protein
MIPRGVSSWQPALPIIEEYVQAPVSDRAAVVSELELVALCVALGAADHGGSLSAAERALVLEAGREPADVGLARSVAARMRAGDDSLGEAFGLIRDPYHRRMAGAFYTPAEIVEPMVAWVMSRDPARVIDAGCGSGRFTRAVAERRAGAEILAVDLDPVATLMTRAAVAVLEISGVSVINGDFTGQELRPASGPTAFLGNPPYVRHHGLTAERKAWAKQAGRRLGVEVSGLSGLHAHFILAAALMSRPGDLGCFVTSSEWLDVGYGRALRKLMLTKLGVRSIQLLQQKAAAFNDAQATAAITCWQVGPGGHPVWFRRLDSIERIGELEVGERLTSDQLENHDRWTRLTHTSGPVEAGMIRLGDLVSVHRGLVTGANDFFLLSHGRARELELEDWCVPAITDAGEILGAGDLMSESRGGKLLLKPDASLDPSRHPALDRYLRTGAVAANGRRAIKDGYICSHRRPWWYVGGSQPPPMVASYMARQPPRFALNPDRLELVNIGHGLYPRLPMSQREMRRLVRTLNQYRESFAGRGRTYQGGLEKFEPSELENLPVLWPPVE